MPRSTILVIDDEPNILKTVKLGLEVEGYSVETAGNGALGLAKLAEHDVDLVLLDVMMPGETGLQLLDERAAGERVGRPEPADPIAFPASRSSSAEEVAHAAPL